MTSEQVSKEEKLPDWLRRWYSLKGELRFREAADEIERLQREIAGLQMGQPPAVVVSTGHEPRAATGTVLATLRDLRHVAEASGRTVSLSADNILDLLGEIGGRDTVLTQIDELLQTMILSAEVFSDADGTVTGYKIKTGALHKIVGLRTHLFFPQNMKEAERLSQPPAAKCEWGYDAGDDVWHTTCGQMHCFNIDGPTGNDFKWCPYCRNPIDDLSLPSLTKSGEQS